MSIMRNVAVSLALATVLVQAVSTQAQSKKIHEQVDPYTGLSTLLLEVPTHTCPGDPSVGPHDPTVHLLFSASQTGGAVSYFITPELDHGSVFSIRIKGTMDTLIDGSVSSFNTPTGSSVVTNYDGDRSYLHETIPFLVSQADMAKLTHAESFQFRINGTHQSLQRCIDAKGLRDLAEFLSASSEYSAVAPQSPTTAQTALNPSQPQIREEVDSQTHLKRVSLGGIETHACPGGPSLGQHDPAIDLTLIAEQHPDNTVKYFLATGMTPDSPLNLRHKDSLDVQMDGVTYTFATPHGSMVDLERDETGRPFTHESINFHVDRRHFVAMAQAKEVQLSINAPQQVIQRCVDGNQLKDVTSLLGIAAGYYTNRAGSDARKLARPE